ncbi:MAG: hypothetical protein IJ087_06035 [Eggerthellaceae bacterium]|nr:hypothetical protein [Eggerthellaceae bacterium]
MPETARSIFNRRAEEKLRSSDDLDRYVRVTNPSAWAVIAALGLLLAGLLAWGVFGAVSTSVTATGARVDGRTMCFLSAEDVTKVEVGDTASVGGVQLAVTEVARVPLSRDEARGVLGNDYLVSALVKGDWAYPVSFDDSRASDLEQGVPLAVSITTERISPIKLLFG